MAVPTLRRRIGMIEIENRESKAREAMKKRREREVKNEITPKEHEERLKKLKEIGLIK